MTPRDDDKGNYDDTEFPPDSDNDTDNTDKGQTPAKGRATGRRKRADTHDEGDYDDKDQ